ncbi:unnamed protein product [Phytophthora fragariaefolia]|uniref:Unnamed protein product n=1 Tax=Phytophthora fragariaefolia TaxID=1490495 RepID=A0A9W7CRW7_9STRA|nr:unnamed protein product [Phytophthora fragariaefolia]
MVRVLVAAPELESNTRSAGTPTPATGTHVAFAAEQSAAVSASPGNADTRPMGPLITPVAGPTAAAATEQSVAKPALAPSAQGLVPRGRGFPRESVPLTTYQHHPDAAAAITRMKADDSGVTGTPLSSVQQRLYADIQIERWLTGSQGATDTNRHLLAANYATDSERAWTSIFQAERLGLPVVSTCAAHQVDFRHLFLQDGSRDYVAVIALLQTMLHDASFSFVNLVPSGGRKVRSPLGASRDSQALSDALSLRELLVAEQDAWNLIAEGQNFTVRREDAPFQVLDPGTPEDYQLEENGNILILTAEERDLTL